MKGCVSLERQRADECRASLAGLRSLPPPTKGDKVLRFIPSLFDEIPLRAATRVAFQRGPVHEPVRNITAFDLDFRQP